MSNIVKTRMWLSSMPYDRWDESQWCHVHATGFRVQTVDGSWHTEYEDDDFVDAPDCVYIDEEDEDYDKV